MLLALPFWSRMNRTMFMSAKRHVSSCHQGHCLHYCKGPIIHDQRGIFLPWQWVGVKLVGAGEGVEKTKQSFQARSLPGNVVPSAWFQGVRAKLEPGVAPGPQDSVAPWSFSVSFWFVGTAESLQADGAGESWGAGFWELCRTRSKCCERHKPRKERGP